MAPGPLGGGGQGGVYEGDGDLVIEGGLAPGAQEDLLTLLQELRARARDGGLASPGTKEVNERGLTRTIFSHKSKAQKGPNIIIFVLDECDLLQQQQ